MKLRHLTCLAFILCMGTVFSQQRIKNINIEIEYYTEKEISFNFFNTSEDSYQLNLLSGNLKELTFQLKFRMEDELSSEETYTLLSEITFFDLELNHKVGPFQVSWAVENLLGFNSPIFAIEGSLQKDIAVVDNVTYAHEADFMVSTALTYNF